MPWILTSFIVALVLDSVAIGESVQIFNPPWTLMVLVYWCWIVPARFGPVTGFCVGILLDTLGAGVLGVHALGGALVGFLANRLRGVYTRTTLLQQTLLVLGVVLIYKVVVGWIQSLFEPAQLGLAYWYSSVVVILAWPLVYTLLKELTPIKRRD